MKPGFVYMAQFLKHPTHYKIGSTEDIKKRMDQLRYEFGELKIVSLWFSKDKVKSESAIQNELYQYSYCKKLSILTSNKFTDNDIIETFPMGRLGSTEFFIFNCFNKTEIPKLFRRYCNISYDVGIHP